MRKGMQSRLSNILKAFVLPIVLAVAVSSGLLAAELMVKQVNLTYLTRRSDVIVQGKVTEVLRESLPGHSNISTIKVTLNIEKMVRGPQGKTYTFREILIGNKSKSAKSSYALGQRLLLFLPSPSQYGLSSPIGMEQGRFYIVPDNAGKLTAVNESNNAGLFVNVAQEAGKEGQKLTASQLRTASTRGGPVQLDELMSLVNKFTSLSRIQ
jgi:hypothetical protein